MDWNESNKPQSMYFIANWLSLMEYFYIYESISNNKNLWMGII